jgi:hypothetical protein
MCGPRSPTNTLPANYTYDNAKNSLGLLAYCLSYLYVFYVVGVGNMNQKTLAFAAILALKILHQPHVIHRL